MGSMGRLNKIADARRSLLPEGILKTGGGPRPGHKFCFGRDPASRLAGSTIQAFSAKPGHGVDDLFEPSCQP